VTRIAVVGAGFAGAVVARELAEAGLQAEVFEERSHVGGHCHTERDAETGVMLHVHGPHAFHTPDAAVWHYVNRFGRFRPFEHRVRAVTKRGVFSLPINLLTVNQFFGQVLAPDEARALLSRLGDASISEPRNFEEQALRFLGRELYEAFFYGYSRKQWGVSPTELPASVLKRLPVRFSYDDRYFNDTYQGIPEEGYTAVVARILEHPAIGVRLSTPFTRAARDDYDHVFCSGPLDRWFDYDGGRLPYRALRFERQSGRGDMQGCAQLNYCDESVPWTRVCEPKHFTPWEEHELSVCLREYSSTCGPDDVPSYPLNGASESALLARYRALAECEPNVTFIGRLGTYRYLDMHVVVQEARQVAAGFLRARSR
jgi:UDP-galactopyranose mutase